MAIEAVASNRCGGEAAVCPVDLAVGPGGQLRWAMRDIEVCADESTLLRPEALAVALIRRISARVQQPPAGSVACAPSL
ncbi:MAG: hypothetical protein AAF371_14925, partial [Pseudomonadota bacterium]